MIHQAIKAYALKSKLALVPPISIFAFLAGIPPEDGPVVSGQTGQVVVGVA
jgi:hypothetical protein